MPAPRPEPVSLHLTGSELHGRFVIAHEDGANTVVDVERGTRNIATILNNRKLTHTVQRLHRDSELGDMALAVGGARPLAAYRIPDEGEKRRISPRFLFAVFGTMAVTMIAFGYAVGTEAAAIPVMILAGIVAGALVGTQFSPAAHRVWLDGELLALSDLVHPDHDDRAGERIVDAVKTEYGALVGDVVARIEMPALFDVAVPQTMAFTELMVQWDRNRDRLRADQRLELASQIRVAFDAAHDHAQHRGLRHIPAEKQATAASALKAYRLSRDEGASDSERAAALSKANELLRSLMLHYMPTPDELEELRGGRARLALPGRIEDLT